MFQADRMVVAFDGHEDSKKALKKAIALAKTFHAKLTVAYAHDGKSNRQVFDAPRPITDGAYIGGGMADLQIPPVYVPHDEQQNPIFEDHTEEVVTEAKMILNEEQFEAAIEIVEGEPADAIIEYAETISADLIVMGARDQSRLKKMLFGSVSEKLSSKSDIPVLIVK
ncbi:universal stress protein [Bacillus sp. Bos-x628]|uniref:universal stress protein n=1 Tax=Bacillus maqinnsis TaxID=3229854 RepID=UPI00338F955A